MGSRDDFYILKIKEATIYQEMIDKAYGEYKINRNDKDVFKNANDNFHLAVFIFDNNFKPIEIKIAECEKTGDSKFHFNIKATTKSKMKIDNFSKQIDLDLKADFSDFSYLYVEYAIEYFFQFYMSLSPVYIKSKSIVPLEEYKIKKIPDTFGQNDINSIKMWEGDNCDSRGAYEKDRDKIYHSKSFRRLVDKAQIFTASKGDHFRTRMTHTLEVSQIARSISRRLKLNEDLTEAIALGHDLGHTPFGHQGERTLDMILSGKIALIKNIELPILRQRFKHNYQALRVLTLLETNNADINGLNLSYQVLEGIWKHTRIEGKIKDGSETKFELANYFKYEYKEYLSPEILFPTSLEGQVVAISDEIAQRSHDIDDAFKSGKLDFESFEKFSSLKKADPIYEIWGKIVDDINSLIEKGSYVIDKNDLLCSRLCSELINYFINNVVENTQNKLKKYDTSKECYQKMHKFDEKMVTFDCDAQKACDLLENLINKRVINSSEVAQFDTTSSKIIETLFKYYYENPLCLPDKTLKKLNKEIAEKFQNIIDFRDGDLRMVQDELRMINTTDLKGVEKTIQEEYLVKRGIFVRCIADHISGMTDSYAIREYKKIGTLL